MKSMTVKLDPELKALLAKKNVHSVGRGFKKIKGKPIREIAWIVTVEHKEPVAQLAPQDVIPSYFKGLRTDVIEGARHKATRLPEATVETKSRTDKWRPAPGGVSIGHFEITAGTLGCIVYKNGKPYILSNNHVFANCNDAELGDPILQPGKVDGGQLNRDEIGELSSFIPIEFGGPSFCPFARGLVRACNFLARRFHRKSRLPPPVREAEANLVDCALAKPHRVIDVSDKILEIGLIGGETEPQLGMIIQKSGRTTGLTQGIISQVDVTADVNYGKHGIATFTDCFATEDISDSGDSGSAALTKDNKLAGLLFAGSDIDTIFCKYSNVKEALGLD